VLPVSSTNYYDKPINKYRRARHVERITEKSIYCFEMENLKEKDRLEDFDAKEKVMFNTHV
jgi:hypothetical protein